MPPRENIPELPGVVEDKTYREGGVSTKFRITDVSTTTVHMTALV